MMVDKGKYLSRQSSATVLRRNFASMLTSSSCCLFMCAGIVFFTGLLFGLFLNEHLFKDFNQDRMLFARPARDLKRGTGKGQTGHSIKKDLSIQFRDYIPRLVFIDSSLGPPISLELFTETYPNAERYFVYVFLADRSYEALYAKFPKVKLYPGTVPSTNQKAATKALPLLSLQTDTNNSISVSTIDFTAWLKDNVHPDEYVIVKMTTDTKNEEQIMQELVTSQALEWIDKYYTTSSDNDLIKMAKESFGLLGYDVFLWDDDKHTYSDFETLNLPGLDRNKNVKISECQRKNDSYFTVLLYFSRVNKYASSTLRLLRQQAGKLSSPLPLTLFVSLDYLNSQSLCHGIASLQRHLDLGLYLQASYFTFLASNDTDELDNRIRNNLVSAEHCFSLENVTLDCSLTNQMMNSKTPEDEKTPTEASLEEQISNRRYTTMDNVYDLTAFAHVTRIDFQKVVRDSGSDLLAIDISAQGAAVIVLQLLTEHISSLLPLRSCIAQQAQK